MQFFDLSLEHLNELFTNSEPQDILCWAWHTFGDDLVVTSSFQSQSIPLLHMIADVIPEVQIFFLDTGFHFPETLEFRDHLIQRWGLKVKDIKPKQYPGQFSQSHSELYRSNPDLCCYKHKVKPFHDALQHKKAWLTGIRRDQSSTREDTTFIRIDNLGLYKICPFTTWTQKDIYRYIDKYNLPSHPLLSQGFMSVGCAPCTRPIFDNENERAGRWAGQNKVECGLHLSVNEDASSTND